MKNDTPEIRTVNVTRYVTPLREGGSLPAITEADDGFMYVLKFRGAGQGVKALIAELIGGELAKALALKIPEIVFCKVDEAYGRTEPDEEIQDLLKASTGLNLGLHYLAGSTTFDPVVTTIEPDLASRIVWLDSLIKNVDRTIKNTNMLLWQKELWLIDHGASLYFHHSWDNWQAHSTQSFPLIKNHVLLPQATQMNLADELSHSLISEETIHRIVQLVPEDWLLIDSPFDTAENHRAAYEHYLVNRFIHSSNFVKEAQDARKTFI